MKHPDTKPSIDPSAMRATTHDLWSPEDSANATSFELGAALVAHNLVPREKIDAARRVHQQTPKASFHDILLDMGADETAVMHTLAEGAGLEFVTPTQDCVDMEALAQLSLDYCKARRIVPLLSEDTRRTLATADAHDIATIDEVRAELGGCVVRQVLCGPSAIASLLESAEPQAAEDIDLQQLLADAAEADVEVIEGGDEDEVDDGSSSPVVRYVNHIIQTAVREGASDIHIEPSESAVKIRLRIDGVMYETMNPPRKMLASITSRIKIMASLDIAERRLPQDGRIRLQVHGRPLDLRISTAPTPHGEKTVMRLLDNRTIQVPLDDLGFSP